MKYLIQSINNNYLQRLKLLSAIIFFACLLQACSGNNSAHANAGKANAANENVSDASSLAGSFSCKIGGKDFSGRENDGINLSFINSGGGVINFDLFSRAPGEKRILKEMNFFVANTGTTTIRRNDETNYQIDYSDPTMAHNCECNEMTVSVTPLGTSRITGTFSGTFIDDADKIIPVTDGKFDLPSLRIPGKK